MRSIGKRALFAVVVALSLSSAVRAELVMTAEPVGDKTTSPKMFFAENSNQNVLMKVRVQNTDPTPHTLNTLRVSFTNTTNMGFIAANYIHIILDPDNDGNLLTPPGKVHNHDLSLHAVRQMSPPMAIFTPNPGAVTFPANSVTYFFIAYDTHDVAEDHAKIDCRITSPSDVAASGPVSFNGAPFLDSAGTDTIDVVAVKYTMTHPAVVTAGQPFDVALRAVDHPGNLDLDATAVLQPGPASQDAAQPSPNGTAPVYPAAKALVAGQGTYSGITLFRAGPPTRVGFNWVSGFPGFSANTEAMQVQAGPSILRFVDSVPDQKAGVAFDVRVSGNGDAYGNGQSGSVVQLTGASGSGPAASKGDDRQPAREPAYSPPQTWREGMEVATFTVTLYRAESARQLAAVNPASPSSTGVSNAFNIVNNSTDHVHIDMPDRAFAGHTFNGVFSAHDLFNNNVVGFGGTLHCSVSPSSTTDVIPADFTAPTGERTLPFLFYQYGTRRVNVYDLAFPSVLTSTDTVIIELPYMNDTIAYPSPYRPKNGPMNVRFYADGGGAAKITIYNFEGLKVREWSEDISLLGADGVKRTQWDGKDDSGNDVPAGLYYLATEAGGKQGRIKFGVIQ